MFEELDKNEPSQPAAPIRPGVGLPPLGAMKTEDIFAETDKTVKPEIFRPRPDNLKPAPGTVIPEEMTWKKNKILIFSLLLGGLAIISAGSYFGLKSLTKKPAATNNSVNRAETQNMVAPVSEPVIENQVIVPADLPIETQPIVTVPADTDQDGLTDEAEINSGTNPSNPDSDSDGLTDREEVNIYLTDPLKSDTDGDGYKDGDEVRNGYNPKGAGKLYEIK